MIVVFETERKKFKSFNSAKIVPKTDIAQEFQLPVSTLDNFSWTQTGIQWHQNNAAHYCQNISKFTAASQKIKALLRWFDKPRASNIAISGMILKEKALKLASLSQMENFDVA